MDHEDWGWPTYLKMHIRFFFSYVHTATAGQPKNLGRHTHIVAVWSYILIDTVQQSYGQPEKNASASQNQTSAHATTSLLLHSWRSMEKRTREFTATKHIIAVCEVILYSHCYKAMAGQHGEGEIKIPWAAQPERSASALTVHTATRTPKNLHNWSIIAQCYPIAIVTHQQKCGRPEKKMHLCCIRVRLRKFFLVLTTTWS